MGIYIEDYKVSLTDVGEASILTNKGIFNILQEVAASASDSVGYGPNDCLKTNIAWILLNWKVKVFDRPLWNSKLTLKTWPRNVSRCYSCRDIEIYDEARKTSSSC